VQRQKEVSRLFGVPASDFVVIPDGINVKDVLGLTPAVAQLFHEENLPDVDIVALTPTRIVRRKNLEAGMEIVAAMKKLGKSVRWMITGAPDPHNADAVEYYRKLTSLRSRLKIRKEVMFLSERLDSRVSDEDLRALFGVCNMLIFPSLREGFGLPVLEGGLSGLVMVLSDIPAFREIAGKDAVYIKKGESVAKTARRAISALGRSPRLVFRKKTIRGYCWSSVFTQKIVPAVTKPNSCWKKG
jgi:glycosyltransferase involved in cell wall biosynthesis